MSWQAYVDSSLLGSGYIKKGAIIGLDGATWATSPDFTVSHQEATSIVNGFKDSSPLSASGLYLNGEKYFFLRADDRTINCKLEQGGVFCVKTGMCVLIGTYDSTAQPGQASIVVENLADYLINAGY